MNYLKYIYNSIITPFTVPDSWEDVPFKTFVAYNRLIEEGKADNQQVIYNLFMPDVPLDYWNKPHDPKLYQSINNQLNFISTEPSKEVPTHIVHDDYNVIVPTKIDNVTANQYFGALKAVNDVVKDKGTDVNTLEIMPELIAILMFKETGKGTIESLAKEINELPTDKVYGLGCFFLQKLTVLKNGTTLICRVKDLMRRILTLVMAEFLIIMVILLRLITFRKGSLVSVLLYLKRKLLKFTCRYRLPLIFKSVKENIPTS